MPETVTSLSTLLHPVLPADFLADSFDQAPLHIRGEPGKFASVMSWEVLNRLLAMDVWTGQTLQLYADTRQVPPAAYCERTVNRNRQQVMQPDAEKVMALIRRGASLLLNEVESLHAGTLAVAQALQEGLGAKSAANIYCSWQRHQAFDSHYDRHDVFVLQISGAKAWRIYEGRTDNPIEHTAFYKVPQAEYDRLKGLVASELEMRPGDLLYLPRGQFHDALASSAASLHVTFCCTRPTGLDLLTRLWEQAVGDSLFRAYLPQQEEALQARVAELMTRLNLMADDDEGRARTMALQESFRIKRPAFDLPNRGTREPSPDGDEDQPVVHRLMTGS